jgi:hypothetical protein
MTYINDDVRIKLTDAGRAWLRKSEDSDMTYLPFNINDNVRIKLTDAGRAWLRKRHAQWSPHIKYKPPSEDAEGWSIWQVHVLMSKFGDGVGPGRELLFEPIIELLRH